MKRQPLLIALSVAALAAAGCAGGGALMAPSSPTTAQSTGATSKATLTVTIPSKSSNSSTASRTPQYISPATNSATFTVGGGTAQVIDLSSSSSACTPATGGGRTCTATIGASVGTAQSLLIKTFASTDGTGNALTVNTESIDVSSNPTSNNFAFTLTGVMASFTVGLSVASVSEGNASGLSATLTALDASGATIIGTVVGADGNPITATPTLTANPATGFTIGAWDDSNGSFSIAWDGTGATSPVTFTAAVTGYSSATTTLEVVLSPTPSPTASPTTAPVNVLANGDFSQGIDTGNGWYTCYAPRITTSGATPIDASPAPVNQLTVVPNTTPAPIAAAGNTSVQTTTPSGALPPSGNAQFALVGYSGGTGLPAPASGKPGKGNTGICQDIASVPANAKLTFSVYEGGDDNWSKSDDEADLYPSGAMSSTSPTASVAPTVRLYAQNNCYDSAGFEAIFLPAPWGTGSVAISSTARWSGCPQTPGGASPGGYSPSSGGGYWYAKSLDLSSYSGEPVTLFLGISRDAAGSVPTASGAQYYNYAFYDNVVLSATSGCAVGRRGAQSINGKRTPSC